MYLNWLIYKTLATSSLFLQIFNSSMFNETAIGQQLLDKHRTPNIIVINLNFLSFGHFSFPLSYLKALYIILSRLILVKKTFCFVLRKRLHSIFPNLVVLKRSLKFQSYFNKTEKEMFYGTILS